MLYIHCLEGDNIGLCECGCGNYTKPGNKFIHGHNIRLDSFQDKRKQKAFESNIGNKWNVGKKFSEEHKLKIKNSNKNKHSGSQNGMYKKKPWNKGLTGMYSEETLRNMSENQKGHVAWNVGKKLKPLSEEHKLNISNSLKGEKGPFFGQKHSDETKNKISESLKGNKLSPETITKISGKNNHSWKGGISYEPYCPKFNEKFKESIRNKFNRTCFLCGISEIDQINKQKMNGKRPYKLSIHHVNYDKTCLCENIDCEFVPLCIPCHSKTNHNRRHYEELIISKLKS